LLTIYCREKQFRNIEAIVLDKDGTLEDSSSFLRDLGMKITHLLEQQIPGVGEPLLRSFGIVNNKLDPTGLMAVGSRLENEIAAAAYIAQTGKSWFESKIIAQKAFNEAQLSPNDSSIFFGAWEVLKTLHQAGLKLAILSSDSTININTFIGRHQLSDLIDIFQGADQGYSKPDPACFRAVCQKLGVLCENALMVGDSQMDIQMAKNAHAAGVIGICWGDARNKSLEGADVTIAHLQEIRLR